MSYGILAAAVVFCDGRLTGSAFSPISGFILSAPTWEGAQEKACRRFRKLFPGLPEEHTSSFLVHICLGGYRRGMGKRQARRILRGELRRLLGLAERHCAGEAI